MVIPCYPQQTSCIQLFSFTKLGDHPKCSNFAVTTGAPLQETEDGLMRKCCRRALDLFTAEGNAKGTGGRLDMVGLGLKNLIQRVTVSDVES